MGDMADPPVRGQVDRRLREMIKQTVYSVRDIVEMLDDKHHGPSRISFHYGHEKDGDTESYHSGVADNTSEFIDFPLFTVTGGAQ